MTGAHPTSSYPVGWHPHLHGPSGRRHGARWRDGAAAGRDVVGGDAAPPGRDRPGSGGPVLDLAAVGIVNSGWRNSPVEDWHAGDGPLDDGDMLRINAHTTWRVRQIIRRWRAEVCLTPESHVTVLPGRLLSAHFFRSSTTPVTRIGDPTEACEPGCHPHRRRSPTVLVSNESSGVNPGALNRMLPSGLSTPVSGAYGVRCPPFLITSSHPRSRRRCLSSR